MTMQFYCYTIAIHFESLNIWFAITLCYFLCAFWTKIFCSCITLLIYANLCEVSCQFLIYVNFQHLIPDGIYHLQERRTEFPFIDEHQTSKFTVFIPVWYDALEDQNHKLWLMEVDTTTWLSRSIKIVLNF